jgi:hypothetical protein
MKPFNRGKSVKCAVVVDGNLKVSKLALLESTSGFPAGPLVET